MKECCRCLYNENIPAISFDENGLCNYCNLYDSMNAQYPVGAEGRKYLEDLAVKIKHQGKKNKYDCVIGVSGGCDSSYLMVLAKELGLRPLAVHFDNTWNSKIAVENIKALTNALDIDLYTLVVDNREYNDIFKSFLKASVPEIDTPSDIGLATTHYIAAKKFGIKYILEGHSFRTEGITPPGWFYMDAKYIQTIHKEFGSVKMNTFPNLWLGRWMRWMVIDGIRKIRPLYYMDYDKEKTKELLSSEYGWQWYGGHHMENRTSYFTNNYYLPKKFGIDLRVVEFSALVRSGQITKEAAIEKIKMAKEFDPDILADVKKRLNITDEEFGQIMDLPCKSYKDYHTYKKTFERLKPLFWILYKSNMVTRSFYLKFTNKN